VRSRRVAQAVHLRDLRPLSGHRQRSGCRSHSRRGVRRPFRRQRVRDRSPVCQRGLQRDP
jgi:hypothetical protein